MPSIHALTVPPLVRGLTILSHYLDRAEADAALRKIAPGVLLSARLYPDMLNFTAQVQRISDTAKASVARLSQAAAPSFADTETSFAELRERAAKTSAFIEGVPEAAFEGADTRSIELKFGPLSTTVTGEAYLTQFLWPNFYFHLSMVHAILRRDGVPVGKRDFLGEIG